MKRHTLLMMICFIAGISCVAQTKARLNQVALPVHNLQKSTQFYQRIVGLDTIPELFHDGKHIWFAVNTLSHLHLIHNERPIITPSKNTHLCFSIASVPAFSEKLKNAGMVFEDWAGTKGAITTRVNRVNPLYLQDLDSYWEEINDDNPK